jgi:hypothetical protein
MDPETGGCHEAVEYCQEYILSPFIGRVQHEMVIASALSIELMLHFIPRCKFTEEVRNTPHTLTVCLTAYLEFTLKSTTIVT